MSIYRAKGLRKKNASRWPLLRKVFIHVAIALTSNS